MAVRRASTSVTGRGKFAKRKEREKTSHYPSRCRCYSQTIHDDQRTESITRCDAPSTHLLVEPAQRRMWAISSESSASVSDKSESLVESASGAASSVWAVFENNPEYFGGEISILSGVCRREWTGTR